MYHHELGPVALYIEWTRELNVRWRELGSTTRWAPVWRHDSESSGWPVYLWSARYIEDRDRVKEKDDAPLVRPAHPAAHGPPLTDSDRHDAEAATPAVANDWIPGAGATCDVQGEG